MLRRGRSKGMRNPLRRDKWWETAFFTAGGESPVVVPGNSIINIVEWLRVPAGVEDPLIPGYIPPEDYTLQRMLCMGEAFANPTVTASSLLQIHEGAMAWDNVDAFDPGNNPTVLFERADSWIFRRFYMWVTMVSGTFQPPGNVQEHSSAVEDYKSKRVLPDNTGILWVMSIQNDHDQAVAVTFTRQFIMNFLRTEVKRK